MQIASMTSVASLLAPVRTPEAKEGAGPDRDGDSDDKSAVSSQPVSQASPPAGMGRAVNVTA